jgi:hypothetical protein
MNETAQFFVLHGTTIEGQRFRPSDWAERLAGVLAPYRPPGSRTNHLTYSPFAVPKIIDGVRCVVIDNRLRALEPLAWKFVHDFARDNRLQTSSY